MSSTPSQTAPLNSIRGARFINHTAFGRALRRFLSSRAPLSLLPDCGWLDGGCLILRDALVHWGAGALHAGAALRVRTGKTYVDHGFAWADVRGIRIIVDGDGLQDEAGLLHKLSRLEYAPGREVRYDECHELVVGILSDAELSGRLSELLSRRFGRFAPNLLLA